MPEIHERTISLVGHIAAVQDTALVNPAAVAIQVRSVQARSFTVSGSLRSGALKTEVAVTDVGSTLRLSIPHNSQTTLYLCPIVAGTDNGQPEVIELTYHVDKLTGIDRLFDDCILVYVVIKVA